MRRFWFSTVLLFVAACRTIEPGSGPLTLSPQATRSFEQYMIGPFYPLGFAVTQDGAFGGSVVCPDRGGCVAGWQDALVRGCEAESGGQPCFLLAKRREIVWNGPIAKDGDLDFGALEATAVRYVDVGSDRVGDRRAEGAIIFLPRRPGQADDHNGTVPPYLVALDDMDWDIVRANIAPTLYSAGQGFQGPVVASLTGKVHQLRASGYKKIIVAGHVDASNSLSAIAGQEEVTLDGLIAVAPYGWAPSYYSHELEELPRDLPLVLAIFRDDENAKRDHFRVIKETLTTVGVRHYIINKPEGISGSNGGWSREFGERFATCIHDFFVAPTEVQHLLCATAPPDPGDHRWMYSETDMEGSPAALIDAAALASALPGTRLVGKSPRGDEVIYEFVDKKSVTITGFRGQGPTSYPYRIRAGELCIGKRTCTRLYRWDENLLIAVSAWDGDIEMRIQLSPEQAATLDAAMSSG